MELHPATTDPKGGYQTVDESWDHSGHLALQPHDLAVKTLGPCRIASPLMPLLKDRRPTYHAVEEGDRVLLDDTLSALSQRKGSIQDLPAFEPAGPRTKIYFDPSKTRAAIVTCGGLCPGLNDVIRALVLELSEWYGIRKIYGFRNGYEGFIASYGRQVVDLDRASVAPSISAGRLLPVRRVFPWWASRKPSTTMWPLSTRALDFRRHSPRRPRASGPRTPKPRHRPTALVWSG